MRRGGRWVWFYALTIALVLLAADWGSKAVTVAAENQPMPRNHCIIIDPGHGGEDGGAISCTGLVESTYNLQISLRVNDLFHLLGYQTKMTRTTDTSIYTTGQSLSQKKMSDLKERVRIVNETDNGFLVSIHQNNFSDSQSSGAQVFYAATEYSKEAAEQMQTALKAQLNPQSHRAIKKSTGIYLMEHIQRPGILIECGFLSNPAEEAQLRDPEYQKELACVIASSISQSLSNT